MDDSWSVESTIVLNVHLFTPYDIIKMVFYIRLNNTEKIFFLFSIFIIWMKNERSEKNKELVSQRMKKNIVSDM
jgi:hypothetical protein